MKNFKRLLALALSLVLLVGCGGGANNSGNVENSGGQEAESTASDQDTLVFVSRDINYTLDPTQPNSPSYLERAGFAEALFRVTPDGEVVPRLAESAEMVDDHTWEIGLRDNAVFWSGKEVTAEEVIKALENTRTESADGEAQMEGLSYEAPEDYKLVVKTELEKVDVPMILKDFVIYNADLDYSDVENTDYTGFFKMTEYIPKQETAGVIFDDYYGDKPDFKAISFEEVHDDDARVLTVQNGYADIAYNIPTRNVSELEANDEYVIESDSPAGTLCVYNNLERPQLADTRVRQALTWAIDRDELSQLAFEGYAEPSSTWMGSNPLYKDEAQNAVYPGQDLDKANELMEEAGWTKDGDTWTKDGQPFTYVLYTWGDEKLLGEAIQNQWMAFGVDVDLRHVDYSIIEEARETGDWDGLIETWTNYGNAYGTVYQHFGADGSINYGNFSDPEVESMLEELKETSDPAKTKELVLAINEKVAIEAPVIALMPRPGLTAVRANLEGFEPHFIQHKNVVNPNMRFAD